MKLYKQNPLKIFIFIFTIYQIYTLALTQYNCIHKFTVQIIS